jgi:hypothetical protein
MGVEVNERTMAGEEREVVYETCFLSREYVKRRNSGLPATPSHTSIYLESRKDSLDVTNILPSICRSREHHLYTDDIEEPQ